MDQKPREAFALSLAGASILIAQGILLLALPGTRGFGFIFGTTSLILGAPVLVAAIMLHSLPRYRRAWSIVVLVFSVLSVIAFGLIPAFAFGVAGGVLGMIGGILGLTWKPVMSRPMT